MMPKKPLPLTAPSQMCYIFAFSEGNVSGERNSLSGYIGYIGKRPTYFINNHQVQAMQFKLSTIQLVLL